MGQQLPYNPKFVREPDGSAMGEGSLPGAGSGGVGGGGSIVSGPGPYAAASSALIGPVPGGVAGMSTKKKKRSPSLSPDDLSVWLT